MLLIQYWIAAPHSEPIAYSEFKVLLRAKKVQEVALGDGVITGKLTSEGLEGILPAAKVADIQKDGGKEHVFNTVAVNDPELVHELEQFGVAFGGVAQNKWLATLASWVLPALIFIGVWSFFIRRMGMGGGQGGLLEIGKSKAKVYLQKQTGVGFEDAAGIDEAKEKLREVVEFLKNPDRNAGWAGRYPRGS